MGATITAAVITSIAAMAASSQQTQAAKGARNDAQRTARKQQEELVRAEERRRKLSEMAMTRVLQRTRQESSSGRQSQILVSPLGGSGGSQGATNTLIGS